MIRKLYLLATFLIAAIPTTAVGSEFVYKPAPVETNELAMETVDRLFRSTDEVGLDDLSNQIICGPGLWRMIKGVPIIENLRPASATSMVHIGGGKFQPFEGALFQTEEQRTILVQIIRHILKDSEFQIRKPNAQELKVYWYLIPYDIEEPIYLMDNGERKILIDFVVTDGRAQLFWIGDMSQFGIRGDDGQ